MTTSNVFSHLSITKPVAPYVYITGAGPGDASLLTLKTYHLIREVADCVIYDRLISQDILDFIPSSVKTIYAGKSCRKHEMTQDEINQCLVDEALKGQVVVRLKGGDPFIYGRGGEEAEFLIQHKIPFEIVPGVNAADGCCAYAGIPLTHRGVATGVRFITGHQQRGVSANLDWQQLADEHTTLVIYMGLTHLDEICANLIKHGLSAETPAAIIQNGTMKDEKYCIATLSTLVKEKEKMNFQPPSIVVIGKVVGLSEIIKWR